MRYRKNIRGFTLIETVMYIGLFGLLMTGAVVASYEIVRSSSQTSGRNSVQEEGGFVLRKIGWALSGMESYTLPAASEIAVTKYDGTTAGIKRSGGQIVMRESGGTFLPLTTDDVNVTSLVFTAIPGVGSGPAGITAVVVMEGRTFSITRYIRK